MATLPALTGAYGREGGGAVLLTAGSMEFDFSMLRKPGGPATSRIVAHHELGQALLEQNRRGDLIEVAPGLLQALQVQLPDPLAVVLGIRRPEPGPSGHRLRGTVLGVDVGDDVARSDPGVGASV